MRFLDVDEGFETVGVANRGDGVNNFKETSLSVNLEGILHRENLKFGTL